MPRIKELSNLKKLDLSGNNFDTLPNDIGSLTQLEELNLSNNYLIELPDSIGNLTSLKIFNLANNNLKTLPDRTRVLTIVGSNLERFDISNNKLKKLPSGLANQMQLELAKNGSQRKFIFKGNSFRLAFKTALDPFFSPYRSALYNSFMATNAIRKRIKNHRKGGAHAIEIEARISRAKNSKHLDLSNQNLTYEELVELLQSRREELTDLKTLDLSGNNLTELPEAIGNLSNLEELKLSNNGLISLPESIGNLYNLRKLDLSINDFIFLGESMRKLTSLKELNLTCNFRRNLPKCLDKLPSLQKLHVEQALPLKDLVYLMNMSLSEEQTKYYINRKKMDSFGEFVPKIHVYGLNNKLTDEHGEFMPRLPENFKSIAHRVLEMHPNTSIDYEEFLTFYESLDASQQRDILDGSIPLSKFNLNLEKNSAEQSNKKGHHQKDLLTLTFPHLHEEIGGTYTFLKYQLRRRGRKHSSKENTVAAPSSNLGKMA